MKLQEFMQSPVYTCSPAMTLTDAAAQMEAHNVGSLVVIDTENRIVGIVTDRDLALALAHHTGEATTVTAVMSGDVVTISGDAGLDEAASMMDDWGIRRLPVADAFGHPIGIVCLDDLYRYVMQETITLAGAARAQGLPHS
jgi:CBS domain-containing protein